MIAHGHCGPEMGIVEKYGFEMPIGKQRNLRNQLAVSSVGVSEITMNLPGNCAISNDNWT